MYKLVCLHESFATSHWIMSLGLKLMKSLLCSTTFLLIICFLCLLIFITSSSALSDQFTPTFLSCLPILSSLSHVHLPLKRISGLVFEYEHWSTHSTTRKRNAVLLKEINWQRWVPKRQNRVKIHDVNHFGFIGPIMKDTQCASHLVSSIKIENSVC